MICPLCKDVIVESSVVSVLNKRGDSIRICGWCHLAVYNTLMNEKAEREVKQ